MYCQFWHAIFVSLEYVLIIFGEEVLDQSIAVKKFNLSYFAPFVDDSAANLLLVKHVRVLLALVVCLTGVRVYVGRL